MSWTMTSFSRDKKASSLFWQLLLGFLIFAVSLTETDTRCEQACLVQFGSFWKRSDE